MLLFFIDDLFWYGDNRDEHLMDYEGEEWPSR